MPSGTNTQLPGLAPLQVRQVPVQSAMQQTVSKQKVLAQSPVPVLVDR